MPISSQVPIIGYVANGVTKSFAFPFAILSADDLKVKVGADVVTAGFSIAGVGDRNGGSVTFTDAPASSIPIILYREVTLDRTTDYQENGDLLAVVLDDDLDRVWMALQDQLLLADRALRSPIGETLQQLPPASERALMALAFDAAGNPIVVRGTNDGGSALALDLMDTAPGKGAALVGADDGASGSLWTTVAGFIAFLLSSLGASVIGFVQEGVGAVRRSIMDVLRERVSVFDFLTPAQIASVRDYTYETDVTAEVQAAINAAFAQNKDLFAPAGGYLVTGLYLPGRVSGGTDDRGKAFRLYGQGTGEAFVVSAPRGTVFKSATDAPVLQDYLDTEASSNGQVDVSRIRFDGASTTPVVLLQSFYGLSEFHHCVVYQRGTGGGVKMGWGATVDCHHNYVMNRDWATLGLGASRTGTGIEYAPTADNGLVSIRKCTARGWLDAYKLGGGTGTAYSSSITQCEASVVYNGVTLATNADKCTVGGNYLEGGDGGVGINNQGDYNTVENNLLFAGFAVGIQDTRTDNKGSVIQGNLIGLGSGENRIGIDVVSSATFGGYNKNVLNNSISYTLGTNGVNGIKLSGTTPRVNISGNSFDPRGNWTGTDSAKINDISTGGSFGIITRQSGDWELPYLSSGAISLFRGSPVIKESNVAANVLAVPEGSYFVVTADSAATVNRFSAGETAGRFVIFRTTNANMTFTNSAYNKLAGGASFTGPGTITFFIDKVGADNFAYELQRTVF